MKICIYRSQQLYIVLNILFSAEGIFCQQNGELRLNAKGWTQIFFQKIIISRKKFRFVGKTENVFGELVLLRKTFGRKFFQSRFSAFPKQGAGRDPGRIKISERNGIVGNSQFFRRGQSVMKVEGISLYIREK